MTEKTKDLFGARATFDSGSGTVYYYRLNKLEEDGLGAISRLPYSIKVLLEAVLRECDGYVATYDDVANLAAWNAKSPEPMELPFKPARVIMQDFTGVPAVVDLAALRSAMTRLGGSPHKINPIVPVDLVIDHSVQVDVFGSSMALSRNAEIEFERNRERYEFLRWGQQAFANFRVVPPASGIVHQVNLEYMAKGVQTSQEDDGVVAFPDSLVGTDSHTTMINGLGVVGWGVGGIEAEAVMLGQPIYMLTPEVIGFRLTGQLREGVTATDLVLTITQRLRDKGVVGKFVEFYGPGLSNMTLPDRATIANMAPEYGATMGFFPVDNETLRYLQRTGRPEELVTLVERYTKEQGLFRVDGGPDPAFTDTLEQDLGDVEPSLAGPKRPQDRVALGRMPQAFRQTLQAPLDQRGYALSDKNLDRKVAIAPDTAPGESTGKTNGSGDTLGHGSVVIAAITSCTNTSNPSVMLGAGLLAKKAVERGLEVKPYVKTSMAPGSKVVTEYLNKAGLTPYLEQLGFYAVGYGCTTCIGNSGPLAEPVVEAITSGELVVAGVLSGNRNFEGRIHPHVKANYLASPPLVVAYALAGTVDIDLNDEPLGFAKDGQAIYLKDIWPTHAEIAAQIEQVLSPDTFRQEYAGIESSNELWNAIPVSGGALYEWNPESTYIQEPPFFVDLTREAPPIQPIQGARVLVKVGDSVTTDHISPAGAIAKDSPAGQYLISLGIQPKDFNSYGSRRGNDRVMTRGTFANIRLKNQLAPGTEGNWTIYLPTGEVMSIYDAAQRYKADGTSLLVLAGKEYGTGSSRDWAAKGTFLLGIKAVLAESYERIHRSNLVGMGVLPLQFREGQNSQTLGLTGDEAYTIYVDDDLKPLQEIRVDVTDAQGDTRTISTVCRVDTPVEVDYYRNGGILQTVLRSFL
ncbi:MAG: aconitate hydratase AcnA [Anaerolineales bacterium]|nr:MAG: aconitate hydratase AcnA [Anaerolineales bacterium]